jgi:hypothetical protein
MAEALAGLDRRISVLEDWRAFLHNHAIFEHPSDPLNDRYVIPVHNEAGTDAIDAHRPRENRCSPHANTSQCSPPLRQCAAAHKLTHPTLHMKHFA